MTVAEVASRPITPLRLSAAAGLMAGTVPTTGMARASRSASSARVLAVLQATTSTRAPLAATAARHTWTMRRTSQASALVP